MNVLRSHHALVQKRFFWRAIPPFFHLSVMFWACFSFNFRHDSSSLKGLIQTIKLGTGTSRRHVHSGLKASFQLNPTYHTEETDRQGWILAKLILTVRRGKNDLHIAWFQCSLILRLSRLLWWSRGWKLVSELTLSWKHYHIWIWQILIRIKNYPFERRRRYKMFCFTENYCEFWALSL